MKLYRITVLVLVALFALSGGGFPTADNGLLFRTADPNLSIGFRLLPPPPPAVIAPEVKPPPLIKGNISRSGEKIYHQPWSTSYNRTIIDEEHGERWFYTPEEAEAAGWRQALN